MWIAYLVLLVQFLQCIVKASSIQNQSWCNFVKDDFQQLPNALYQTCFAGKHILFVGNSIIRGVMYATIAALQNIDTPVDSRVTQKEHCGGPIYHDKEQSTVPECTYQVGSTNFSFSIAYHMNDESKWMNLFKYVKPDIIVMNIQMGLHDIHDQEWQSLRGEWFFYIRICSCDLFFG